MLVRMYKSLKVTLNCRKSQHVDHMKSNFNFLMKTIDKFQIIISIHTNKVSMFLFYNFRCYNGPYLRSYIC